MNRDVGLRTWKFRQGLALRQIFFIFLGVRVIIIFLSKMVFLNGPKTLDISKMLNKSKGTSLGL